MPLLDLSIEILQEIFVEVPNELKLTCKKFYIMYNNQYFNLLISRFGNNILKRICRYDFIYLIDYIKSLDYWRKPIRLIISNHYKLPLPDSKITDPLDKLNCQYIEDSWKLIYGIYMNRRIFVDYEDYVVNRYDDIMVAKHSVKINKLIKVPSGLYNLSAGLIMKTNTGLNGAVFKIINVETNNILIEYQPASNFGELVPHDKFVLLDMGSFQVGHENKKEKIQELRIEEDDDDVNMISKNISNKNKNNNDDGDDDEKLISLKIVVEEVGVLVKSGFILCFVDINAFQLKDCVIDNQGIISCINEKYWLAWWIENQDPKPENIINILLKRLYQSMERSINNVEEEDNDDDDDKIAEDSEDLDLENYSRHFYSNRNDNGEYLIRMFKFRTQKDRRRYEEWRENKPTMKMMDNEPIKWKMNTILEL
jgi:hypothetical protein